MLHIPSLENASIFKSQPQIQLFIPLEDVLFYLSRIGIINDVCRELYTLCVLV